MSAPESSSSDQSQSYLSKRVMINGQFVTLYSANGQTWLSSPEDIPNTMARLDNPRNPLTEGKGEDGEKKGAKEQAGAKEKEAAPAPKPLGSQYRMKGPKPRPVLRQGGKVVEGTPIEPVSASSVNIKGAADTALPTVKLSPMEQGIRRGKIVAPIAQKRPGKPKVAPPPSTKGKIAPVAGKGVAGEKAKAKALPEAKKPLKAPPAAPKASVKVSLKSASKEKSVKVAPPAKASQKKVTVKLAKEIKKAPSKGKKVSAVKKGVAKPAAKKRSR